MRLDSQFSRMNCERFSTGSSSGALGGSGKRVMFQERRAFGCVPPGLIEYKGGMTPGINRVTDFPEMLCHGEAVAEGHNEAGALFRTDRVEDIGPFLALIFWRGRSVAAFRPWPLDLVFLTYPGFVLEPDFELGSSWKASFDLCQIGGDFFKLPGPTHFAHGVWDAPSVWDIHRGRQEWGRFQSSGPTPHGCGISNFGLESGALRSTRANGPSALNRRTQSRSIWRLPPPVFAATERLPPSMDHSKG